MLLRPFLFLLLLVVFSLVLSDPIFVSKRNPYFEGELTVETTSLSVNGSDLTIYFPTERNTYAVALFVTGFDGDIPVSFYNSFLQNVASHGIIVVGLEFFPPKIPLDSLWKIFLNIIEWLPNNLNSHLPEGVVGDSQGSLVGTCHSSACKILVKLLQETCSLVKSAVLINPVDGADPFGWINDYVITPGQKLNFTLPALILGTGLGPVSRHNFFPACAPAGRNFPRFFNAWNDYVWSINASDYGHADILDPVESSGTYYTQLCASNGYQMDYYWSFISGSVASFIIGLTQGNCQALKYLQDPNLIPIQNVDIQVSTSQTCPKLGCSHL